MDGLKVFATVESFFTYFFYEVRDYNFFDFFITDTFKNCSIFANKDCFVFAKYKVKICHCLILLGFVAAKLRISERNAKGKLVFLCISEWEELIQSYE